MDVITMAKTNSLVAKLTLDFPAISFEHGDDSYWSPAEKTVYYTQIKDINDQKTLLHELAHGILNHTQFPADILLVGMERGAWMVAQSQLGPTYGIAITDEYIDEALDSYRNWLHNRSRCPQCTMNGIQQKSGSYTCLGCMYSWRVNDARRCQLRRYAVT